MASVNPWTRFQRLMPRAGRYTVTISMTLANSGTNGNNNDLYINNPEILCV